MNEATTHCRLAGLKPNNLLAFLALLGLLRSLERADAQKRPTQSFIRAHVGNWTHQSFALCCALPDRLPVTTLARRQAKDSRCLGPQRVLKDVRT